MAKKKRQRKGKEEAASKVARALAAFDVEYRKRREEYALYVEKIQKLDPLAKADAWLSYVSQHIDDFGDQEALVYLVSRGKDCSIQIKDLIVRWKESEKQVIATCAEGVSVHSLQTGKERKHGMRSLAEASKIETLSPFQLRDFWHGYRNQELSIDATMLRTVEWCGMGGFDPWWQRYAKEQTRDISLGGVEPVPLSFWLFNMCRSQYAISLMRKALGKALDAIEVSAYGQTYPWSFHREYDPSEDPPVDHIPFASSIVFALFASRSRREGQMQASRRIQDREGI